MIGIRDKRRIAGAADAARKPHLRVEEDSVDRRDLYKVPFVDQNKIPPVQLLPDGAYDDAEGLRIASLLADDLSYIIPMSVNGKACALF